LILWDNFLTPKENIHLRIGSVRIFFMIDGKIEKHSLPQSILYHLLPGVLTGACYFLIRQPVLNLGYPPMFALTIAAALFLIPLELGFLLVQGRKAAGRLTLAGVISYRRALPWWQVVLWSALVFLAVGAVFALLKPVDRFLQEQVFFWIPTLDPGLDGSFSRPALIVTYALFFILMAVLAPLVEELYFRGYLLPRTPGKLGPVLHSFLFAAYHVFTPWMIVTRTIGLLPLIYTVRKKNIYIGMIVHVLVNTLDVVTAAVFIAGLH
jgi:membrane protease YdiL (CAAX protease family)